MKFGYLSEYFHGVAVKTLSEVEVNAGVSNQHEFNVTKELRGLLGNDKITTNAKFLYLDSENQLEIETYGVATYYDARERHPKRTEFRLYYSTNEVMDNTKAGDVLFIAFAKDGSFIFIITPENSTESKQLGWLFGLEDFSKSLIYKGEKDLRKELDYVSNQLLELIGIESELGDQDWLERLINEFGESFPPTRIFSSFARSQVAIDVKADPDNAVLEFMNMEEFLFRTLERHLVSKQLQPYFDKGEMDVDEFVRLSLSVQNRRKSRAGYALEYHLAYIFDQYGISYVEQAYTERRKKPDFLFPGIDAYRNNDFPAELLRMLGVKTSLKERWAQVLSEADRIERKHLITLQPAISLHQTKEMLENNLLLVIPNKIQDSYTHDQRTSLLSVNDFIQEVLGNQKRVYQLNLDV